MLCPLVLLNLYKYEKLQTSVTSCSMSLNTVYRSLHCLLKPYLPVYLRVQLLISVSSVNTAQYMYPRGNSTTTHKILSSVHQIVFVCTGKYFVFTSLFVFSQCPFRRSVHLQLGEKSSWLYFVWSVVFIFTIIKCID